jgi:hypothetical protein
MQAEQTADAPAEQGRRMKSCLATSSSTRVCMYVCVFCIKESVHVTLRSKHHSPAICTGDCSSRRVREY